MLVNTPLATLTIKSPLVAVTVVWLKTAVSLSTPEVVILEIISSSATMPTVPLNTVVSPPLVSITISPAVAVGLI